MHIATRRMQLLHTAVFLTFCTVAFPLADLLLVMNRNKIGLLDQLSRAYFRLQRYQDCIDSVTKNSKPQIKELDTLLLLAQCYESLGQLHGKTLASTPFQSELSLLPQKLA